jgi:hypothetical protein
MTAAALALAGAICLSGGDVHATIDAPRFTLVWRHSIEKIDWEEDYVVAGDWLYLSGARIRGTGAGMEPPPDAQRVGGVYVYRPDTRWFRELDLARSSFVQDYRVCVEGRCRPMSMWVPVEAGVTRVEACR